MELKFELATEPAVKATIAVGTCWAISHVATHSQNLFGAITALIIGILAVVIDTYKTPPLRAIQSA